MLNTHYNHRKHITFIYEKFKASEEFYNKIFDIDDSEEKFLTVYESMNVFPTYPNAIIMPLKRIDENYELDVDLNNALHVDNTELVQLTNKLNDKLKEQDKHAPALKKLKSEFKIRRFFDYELRDLIGTMITDSKVTNAWVKMYELLQVYKFFDNDKKKVHTFHICEHPGAFVFAIKEYIKRLDKEHDFIFQSLKPGADPKIFKPDPQLINDYLDKLDYGPDNSSGTTDNSSGTTDESQEIAPGDITSEKNIRYYRKKYKDQHFDLITSDCGLNFSRDFTKQEMGMYKIFLGALICAIGVSSKGSNYIFKLFSFNTAKTIELLQLACLFYKRIDIVRLLSNKSGSGEIYCVCLDFNYDGNIDAVMDTLLDYLNNNDGFVLNVINEKLMSRLINHHKLLTMRRITNINMLLFRQFNYEYSKNHEKVRQFVKHLVEYYTNYFVTYLGIK